jgi:hypothetical protein
MKRISAILLALLLATVFVVPAFARGGNGHIYGIVFYDSDRNGSWGNEAGVSNVPVHFVNGDMDIVLYTAWTDNLSSSASLPDSNHDPDLYCSHLDEDHLGIPKGCSGTFGLIPVSGWWDVYIELPAGMVASDPAACGFSASNPCKVQSWDEGEAGWMEFGLVDGAGPPQQVPGVRVFKANKPAGVNLYPVSAAVPQ